jgi:hypothetical protein
MTLSVELPNSNAISWHCQSNQLSVYRMQFLLTALCVELRNGACVRPVDWTLSTSTFLPFATDRTELRNLTVDVASSIQIVGSFEGAVSDVACLHGTRRVYYRRIVLDEGRNVTHVQPSR